MFKVWIRVVVVLLINLMNSFIFMDSLEVEWIKFDDVLRKVGNLKKFIKYNYV